ncbi:Protein POLLENLESS 3-LIKE 2 [Linum grandiflorum]
MLQDMWNAPAGFRPIKSAPTSPAKPSGISRPQSFHAIHKVPVGDTPYVRAKNVQLVEKDPEKAIPLFWAAINAGDRVDSALKDMAIVMKQQNRAEEAIEAIKSLRSRCSDQAQESLDNILLDLYKRCGRLDDQVGLMKHKLFLIQKGLAFNGKRTKTARSQGKKFQVSVEQEATRLLGNLGWALMQQENFTEAEDAYRRALTIAPDNNKMCNLGICLMKQGRISEAKDTLRRVKPAVADGPRGMDSHLKAYERAQQMLKDLESEIMMSNKGGDRVEWSRLFNAFLGSSSIWQPQPCKDHGTGVAKKSQDDFGDENVNATNLIPLPRPQQSVKQQLAFGNSWINVDAPPFYSGQQPSNTNNNNRQIHETLKRKRSGNAANDMIVKPPESKKRLSDETGDRNMSGLLPDSKDFEDAILESILGPVPTAGKEGKLAAGPARRPPHPPGFESVAAEGKLVPRKVEKRLKVFQDITLSRSPRASLI